MPTPQEALAKFMTSPGVKRQMEDIDTSRFPGEGGRYLARRQADITSGVDAMVPDADSMDVRALQRVGQPGEGMSRSAIREGALAKVRGMLKMQQTEDEQAQQMAHIKGGYDVQGDVQSAQAAMDRVLAQQQGQNYRTGIQQEGAGERVQLQTGTQRDIAQGNQSLQRQKLNSSAIKSINAQIAKMEADAVKNRPNALMKMFRGDPRGDAVQTAKQARDIALELARDYPGMDTEDAMLQAGYADYTPDELSQVNAFLGMLRGQ